MPAKIAVIYWSLYGHVEQLAEVIAKGAEAKGAEVSIFRVEETLSEGALKAMHAKPKNEKHAVFKPDQFADFDGFLFGIPTRYGRTPAQWSALLDHTGGLWAKGALVGKFAGVFHSTASQHGGQETTTLTTIPWFAHHGIIYVPIGFVRPELSEIDDIVGGSAWGAGTIAKGDGSRQPSKKELDIATYQGEAFADLVGTYLKGKSA